LSVPNNLTHSTKQIVQVTNKDTMYPSNEIKQIQLFLKVV
jgi:hypothetical protein